MVWEETGWNDKASEERFYLFRETQIQFLFANKHIIEIVFSSKDGGVADVPSTCYL